MVSGLLSSILILAILFKLSACQQPNTDGFFISEFLHKMGLSDRFLHLYHFSSPVCSWRGVGCDSGGNVVSFTVSSLGLSGLVPDSTLGKLGKLQSLDLSNNSVTGLPSDIWSLGLLKSLNLSSNQISGSLPSNIGNFGALETLDISSNNFSNDLPAAISSLKSLKLLNLSNNSFAGFFPSWLLNCRSLTSLDVSSNLFSGFLPAGFAAALPNLKFLNLAGNQIQGRVSDFVDLRSLTYLNISRNLFQGSVMDAFHQSLEVIDLSYNQFSGHISQVPFKWSNLIYLDLSDNHLSGEIFHDLDHSSNMKHLNLAHNRFSRQKFPSIGHLFKLEYLNLSATGLMSIIPVEVSRLSRLSTLDLSDNHLQGQIPDLSATNIRVLDLSHNNLSGEIPPPIIKGLKSMERFNFSHNNLTFCGAKLSLEVLESAFAGSVNSCPIAADLTIIERRDKSNRWLKLALVLTLSMVCLLMGLLCVAFGCRRQTTTWAMKQPVYSEEQNISGPFSFQTDSTTWVADVKQATSVPVVIFEKPLLNFTFVDLLAATSNFDRGTMLAEGRFGPVYRGFLSGGIHVAVKVLVHGSTMTDQEAAKELEYLGRIKHPNLVPLTGYCLAGDQRIAIYDYMENGTLQNLLHDLPLGVQVTEDWSTDTWEEDPNDHIQNAGPDGLLNKWRFRHKIALGTARALAFLHHGCSPPIIHRDVKSSSVYLDSNLEPRLSDFGLAKIFGAGVDDIIARGSPGYVPPEFSFHGSNSPQTPTPKSDVYGFGVILFELLTGKKAVLDTSTDELETTLVTYVRGLVKRGEGLSAIDPKMDGIGSDAQMEEALKIGYLCTAELPSKRPSMQQIVGLLKDIEPANDLTR
uniref:Protein kinase domain-containing protein n=1 Tax=Kalanchoe fedtschenkoi TaxID=63787 RepID=A0A7N0V420_KALFE